MPGCTAEMAAAAHKHSLESRLQHQVQMLEENQKLADQLKQVVGGLSEDAGGDGPHPAESKRHEGRSSEVSSSCWGRTKPERDTNEERGSDKGDHEDGDAGGSDDASLEAGAAETSCWGCGVGGERPGALVLPTIVFAQFAGTSLWFAPNAVMAQIEGFGSDEMSYLTSAVQARAPPRPPRPAGAPPRGGGGFEQSAVAPPTRPLY